MVTFWLTQVNNNQLTKQTLVTHCDSLLTRLWCYIEYRLPYHYSPVSVDFHPRLWWIWDCWGAPLRWGGEGFLALSHPAWVCSPRHQCVWTVQCTVYCALLWRVSHHGNYHGETQTSPVRARPRVKYSWHCERHLTWHSHNTGLLWERRGKYGALFTIDACYKCTVYSAT